MNILIADDHVLFRDTLNHYINRAQPEYKLQMASNLGEVVDVLKAHDFNPDLCILDFRMPGMRGYEGFQDLISAYPEHMFAVMSGVAEPDDIRKLLSLGVAGFIPKTLPGRLMLMAIDTMLQGNRYIPYEQDGKTLLPSYFSDKINSHDPATGKEVRLTARERDVLKLLCQGKSNKEIADALSLKIVTIKLHVRGIFRKLKCGNRTLAAIRAKEMGVFD